MFEAAPAKVVAASAAQILQCVGDKDDSIVTLTPQRGPGGGWPIGTQWSNRNPVVQ